MIWRIRKLHSRQILTTTSPWAFRKNSGYPTAWPSCKIVFNTGRISDISIHR